MGQHATCGSLCQRPPAWPDDLPPDDPKLQVFALEPPCGSRPLSQALRLAEGDELAEEPFSQAYGAAPPVSSRSQARSASPGRDGDSTCGTEVADGSPELAPEAELASGICACGLCLGTLQVEPRPVVVRPAPGIAHESIAEGLPPIALVAGAGAGPRARSALRSEEAEKRPAQRRRPSVPPIETRAEAPDDEDEASQPQSRRTTPAEATPASNRKSRRTSTGSFSSNSVRVSTGAHSVKASEPEVREEEHQRAVQAWLLANGFQGGVRERRLRLTGSTYPLHVAAEQGLVRMVALLLRAGADPDERNGRGLTALDVAQRATRRQSAAAAEIVEALETAARASRREPCAPYASESLAPA